MNRRALVLVALAVSGALNVVLGTGLVLLWQEHRRVRAEYAELLRNPRSWIFRASNPYHKEQK